MIDGENNAFSVFITGTDDSTSGKNSDYFSLTNTTFQNAEEEHCVYITANAANGMIDNCIMKHAGNKNNSNSVGIKFNVGSNDSDYLTNMTVKNNWIEDVQEGITATSTNGLLIENNVIIGNYTNTGLNCKGINAGSVLLIPTPNINMIIRNNTFIFPKYSANQPQVFYLVGATSNTGTIISNNVIYVDTVSSYPKGVEMGFKCVNIPTMDNNVYYNLSSNSDMRWFSFDPNDSTTLVQSTSLSAWQDTSNGDANSIISDPQFVNYTAGGETSTSFSNLHFTSGSPIYDINAGAEYDQPFIELIAIDTDTYDLDNVNIARNYNMIWEGYFIRSDATYQALYADPTAFKTDGMQIFANNNTTSGLRAYYATTSSNYVDLQPTTGTTSDSTWKYWKIEKTLNSLRLSIGNTEGVSVFKGAVDLSHVGIINNGNNIMTIGKLAHADSWYFSGEIGWTKITRSDGAYSYWRFIKNNQLADFGNEGNTLTANNIDATNINKYVKPYKKLLP